MPDFQYEAVHWAAGRRWVAGVDEAGRGPLAGPVVAAAVVLPEDYAGGDLNDSKKLTETRREELYGVLTADVRVGWAWGMASVEEIDALNILRASHLAMRRAVEGLRVAGGGEKFPDAGRTPPLTGQEEWKGPDIVLIDGLPVRDFPWPQQAVVKGDALSLSIAAASIVAKVVRDRLMRELDGEFPHYCFRRHKGYGTPQHLEALRVHGPSRHHRRSFQPVAQLTLDLW